MRSYGIVSPMFWIGKTGRKLRANPDAQRVAMYLMTAPGSEMTGVFYCPISYILNDVGPIESQAPSKGHESPFQGAYEVLQFLNEIGFCFYDFETEFVFVTEMARWQIGEKLNGKDKRIPGIRNAVKSMPEPMKSMFLQRYNDDFSLGFDIDKTSQIEAENPSPFEGASEGHAYDGKPHRSQEQEQEQEQEQINTNKHSTHTEAVGASNLDDVCSENFDDPISEQAENLANEETQKVLDDPEAIVTPVHVIGLARNHGIRLYRSEKLNTACSRKVLTVDNVRQCIRIAKKDNKGGPYLVGILLNAVQEPSQYHTWEWSANQKAKRAANVDENKPF